MGNFNKSFVLMASTGIILTVFLYLLFVSISVPYIGLNVERNESGTWQISDVDHLGWAEQQGIKVGDSVLSINGIQPSSYLTVIQYGVIEQAQVVVIARNGEYILHKVTNNMIPEQAQFYQI